MRCYTLAWTVDRWKARLTVLFLETAIELGFVYSDSGLHISMSHRMFASYLPSCTITFRRDFVYSYRKFKAPLKPLTRPTPALRNVNQRGCLRCEHKIAAITGEYPCTNSYGRSGSRKSRPKSDLPYNMYDHRIEIKPLELAANVSIRIVGIKSLGNGKFVLRIYPPDRHSPSYIFGSA